MILWTFVKASHVKMVEHVQMEQICLPALALRDGVEHCVK